METDYIIKDGGARDQFGQGVRDTEEGKLDWSNLFVWLEPMGTRYVSHMTKGREKYKDVQQGGLYVPNWTLFPATPEVLARTLRSFDRHVKAYRMGLVDEDHAAALVFNLNLAEKLKEEMYEKTDLRQGDRSEQEVGLDAYTRTLANKDLDTLRVRAAVGDEVERIRRDLHR